MRLAIFIAATLVSSGALAQENAERTELCSSLSDLATGVMIQRQAGDPAPEVLQGLEALGDQQFAPIFTDLVVSAYSEPRYNADENKQDAVADFASAAWLECMNAS